MRPRNALLMLALLSTSLVAQPAQAEVETQHQNQAGSGFREWNDVRRILSGITDAYTAPPDLNSVLNTGYTTGLLLGNGDLHVTSDARNQAHTFYLSKSDFWRTNGQPYLGKITVAEGGKAPVGAAVKDILECTATCVIDGTPETRWVSQTNASATDPQWVTLDLGKVRTIDRWVLRHNGFQGRADNFQKLNTQNFALQKSDDGATWTDVDTVTGNTAELTDRTVPAFTARHIRLAITAAVRNPDDPNQKAYIRDLQLFGGGENVISPSPSTDANYHQRQDILNAEVQGTQTVGDQVVKSRTWTADGENLLVTELSTDKQPVPLQVDVNLPGGAAGTAADGQVWATRSTGADGSTDWASKAAVATKVVGTTAVASTPSASVARLEFTLQPGRPVRLVSSVHGNGSYANPTPLAEFATKSKDRIAAVDERALWRAQQNHREWWRRFWLKSYVDTGDATLNKYYYGALYAMGAASREGFFMPGTYSPWRTTDSANLGNRYFMNYNTESQYYGVYSANRPELARPFYPTVRAEVPYARNRTHEAGFQGMTFWRAFSPFNQTRPAPAETPVAPTKRHSRLPSDQQSNGTFSAIPFLWDYEYTGDEKMFREFTYPYLKELGAFWMDFAEKGPDGKYDVLHTGVNEGGDDVNPVYDLGYIRRTLTALITYSEKLGVDAELRPVWQKFLDELSPYPTGQMDGLDVIFLAEKIDNPIKGNALLNKNDQPINLEGVVHPSDNLAIGGDPAMLQLVRNTLQWVDPFKPGTRGSSGNGFPKTFTIAARAGWDAEDLIGKFSTVINDLWRKNLTVRQFGGGQETSGSIETVNSMFLQSFENTIRVFPVWPTTRDGSFTRLRAKGAFLVSASRKAGRPVGPIEVTSEKGGPVTFASPWGQRRVLVLDGFRPVPVTYGTDADTGERTLTFNTRAGHTYKIL
ncbi:discoidin domain-containing protein [Nonomuraea sp. NPDC050790]|uniref:galactose-binding domain-containing protein n=1 Tax=Nonomuraea sp. NPDC050790 TaxID=3364371 RepID=UPI0037A14461